jgi:hypothetical protein
VVTVPLAASVLAIACFAPVDAASASDASVRSAIEKSSQEVKESGALK